MKRREFITLLGGAAAAWPCAARAQQPAMPVIGFLHAQSPDGFVEPLRGFRQGLKDAGFFEGENVAIEYRWAENQLDRLPALAAALVHRPVAVIAAFGSPATLAAKAVTTTIPIVFSVGDDPVKSGLVASLARPGGNLTGINFFTGELGAKRLDLLRELVPRLGRLALLLHTSGGPISESARRDVEGAARVMGLQLQVFNADTSREINDAFASLQREQPDALIVGTGAFLTARRVQITQLAARSAIPATYSVRQYVEVGGLMSYGSSTADSWHHAGAYIARILRGAKPADLPVVRSSKFELVINAETARMLGLTVPPSLLVRAVEVIE